MRILSFLSIFLALVSLTMASGRVPMQRRAIPGGYSPVEDLTEDRVVAAAHFAFKSLPKATRSYSFAPLLAGNKSFTFKIARAYSQVVAGMNYRLVIVLQDENTGICVGAFAATIYNHFGDLTVTKWGNEVSCEKAKVMEESAEAFHATYEEDFV